MVRGLAYNIVAQKNDHKKDFLRNDHKKDNKNDYENVKRMTVQRISG